MPINRLDLTLNTPEENLALDEALLDEAEQASGSREVLRVWEPPTPLVVVGRSSRVGDEVRRDACERTGIPILRRCSGGAAIVAGPGCLMYAVVLSYERRPALRMIEKAHRFVLNTLAQALRESGYPAKCLGVSDLVLNDCKFSGNSLRCKRSHLLYHGTLLYDFPLELIDACLATAPRQPEYRRGRAHLDFVTNLPLERETLRELLFRAWNASDPLVHWPQEATRRLAAQRYSQPEWNFRL